MDSESQIWILLFVAIVCILISWWRFWLGFVVVISLGYFIGWQGMFLLAVLLLIQGGIDLAVKRRA